jgi:adenylate cyclase
VSGSDLKQRLAAILAADVAGYSRLMAADERATVAALDAARKVFRSHIESSQGRVIDMAGDSVLAVFETAVGAVQAALAAQDELETITREAPEDRRLRFRVGVHLGDIFEKTDGSVYGDGINVAARLQALAEPGRVLVSGLIQESVRDRMAATFEDQGEQSVKNIPRPVRTFRVTVDAPSDSRQNLDSARATAATSKQPSIAVLPFDVLSEDPRLGFLADGLVEDVIALLARAPGFLVISRSSSFLFRDQGSAVASVARQLGVRYVVGGSVREVGGNLRVSAQLADAESAQVLWSGRFDSGRDQTEDLQESIARAVMTELEPALTRAEIAVIRRQRPENVNAWGCFRQALGVMSSKGWNEESLIEARSHLGRAVAIDPSFAIAYAYLSLLTALSRNIGFLKDSSSAAKEALELAERALALDDGSSEVLGSAGCAISDLGQHQRGVEILERAVAIDPSNAQAHVALGAARTLLGQVDIGIDGMRYGMRISPKDRRLAFWGWALGGFLLRDGKLHQALEEARTSVRRDPRFYLARILEAATLADLGRANEARKALEAARQLRKVLTLDEIKLAHGGHAARSLAPLWEDG